MTALSFELSKQLEAAGWHQPGTDDPSEGYWVQDGSKDGADKVRSTVYAPSLSELIDACIEAKEGNNEFALFFFDRSTCWWADIGNSSPVMLGEVQGEFRGEGTTKEEAVARLWLALKVKP